MYKTLLLQLICVVFSIVAIYIAEEIICFFIIKKRGELDSFKEYKTKHKKFYLYSQYLYQNKKYLFSIKFILAALVIISTFFYPDYSYYDAVGNNYKNMMDILFYDQYGNSYSIDKDTWYFIDSDNHLTNKCYVDMNGNVADINEDDLYISGISGVSYLLNGKIYFMNTCVYWDEQGYMHYFNGSKDIIISDYEFVIDVKTGNCSIEKMYIRAAREIIFCVICGNQRTAL